MRWGASLLLLRRYASEFSGLPRQPTFMIGKAAEYNRHVFGVLVKLVVYALLLDGERVQLGKHQLELAI
jgi:hypothetical protein